MYTVHVQVHVHVHVLVIVHHVTIHALFARNNRAPKYELRQLTISLKTIKIIVILLMMVQSTTTTATLK